MIKVFVWDTINQEKYDDVDATIVEDIIGITITETCTEMVSNLSITIPYYYSSIFTGFPAYYVVKVKKDDVVIWIGRVMSINEDIDAGQATTVIQCASISVDLTLATGDYQIYQSQKLEQLIYKQAELVLRGAQHGSPVSPIAKDDYIFNVIEVKRNRLVDKVVRSAGMNISSMIQQLLSMGGLFFFTLTYNERSRIIVSDTPTLPNGKGGFPVNADTHISASTGQQTNIEIKFTHDDGFQISHNNITSAKISYDCSSYRDRLRILHQKKDGSTGEIWKSNPYLPSDSFYKQLKSGAKLMKAPWVPQVIVREYLNSEDAERISGMIWNNVNIYCPNFTLSCSSWELDGNPVHVGTKIKFSYYHSIYTKTANGGVNKHEYFLDDIQMVISKVDKTLTNSKLNMQITLTDQRAFMKDYDSKRTKDQQKSVSYYKDNT